MCGIAGVVGRSGRVDTRAMLATLIHRGPDDEGEYRNSPQAMVPVWLGHRRLAVIDPSRRGRQPMRTRCGRYVLVFNGEIYNFRDLRNSLTEFEPHTDSDTEVLLECLARHGAAVLPRLRGMFALALWDDQRATLLLARDRHGEKPLYYFYDESAGQLLFASEIRALLASESVPRQLDPDGLDAYLSMGSVIDPYTLVRGVRAVPAGGIIEIGPEGLTQRRYWTLSDHPVIDDQSRGSVVERVRALLDHAHRRCLVADVPVGLLLSGGIDSSISAALMAPTLGAALRTFSVVFSGVDEAISEERYSTRMARQLGTRHQNCTVSLDDAAAFLERAVASMDQPSHDGLNVFAVSEAVRATGLKVAVSGVGADELFLGYPQRHSFPGVRRRADWFPRPLARLALLLQSGRWRGNDGRHAKFAAAATARDSAAGAFLALHGMFSHRAIERLRGEKRPHPEHYIEPVGGNTSLDVLSRLQIRHYLRDTLLRDADQASMAHGLEVRAPYLDHDLVDFVLSVPAHYKLELRRNKPLLLDAAGEGIPQEIWDRRKRGFAMPVGRWILEGAVLSHVTEIPGLDSAALQAVLGYFTEHGPASPFRYLQAWTLIVLGLWLAHHRISMA